MAQRSDVMAKCANQIADLSQMKMALFLMLPNFLLERRSPRTPSYQSGTLRFSIWLRSSIKIRLFSHDQRRDHLRIQFLKTALFAFRLEAIDRFDSSWK